MACIVKVGNKFENLSGYNTFITDKEINSQYFRIGKFRDNFTAGKNLFLMEGSEFLKESTELKIEIVDAEGNTLYVEPGRGVPDYYEGNSIVLSAHVYDSTPVGPAKITILGELKEYVDESGIIRPVPSEWENAYNVKWEKNFYLNKNEKNSSPVIFYKRPKVSIEEIESNILQQNIPTVTQTGSVVGLAENPPLGTDLTTWRAGELYRFERVGGDPFTSAMDENIISIPSINYEAVIKEVINSNVILVDSPLTDGDLKVINNPNELDYSITFDDFAKRTSLESAVTASYGRITVNNLDTFTGNVDKLKIYKKSRSDIGDYKFVDEVKIVGGNLLRNDLIPGSELDGGFGVLTENNVQTYWNTQSIQIDGLESDITYDNDILYESIRINIPSSSFATESVSVSTNVEFQLYDNTDYELNFKTLVSGAYQDIIVGDVIITSESVSTTYYYKFRPSELTLFEPEYLSKESLGDIESPNSQSVNLTKPLIYDDNRFITYETPQNTIGDSFNSVPLGYLYDSSNVSSITLDTSSTEWNNTSIQISPTDSNANIISSISSLGGINVNVTIWLDSGSYTLPMNGNPQDINVYSEFYSSGSDELAVLSFENIGGDAKLYYYNNSSNINSLESFRNSTEYSLEPIDTNDYQSSPNWHSSSTGSQTIIPFQESGYNYIHIDYRTLREIEPLNANLINVKRLDSIDGDILYGSTYEINSINFETGDIEFSHNSEDGTLSGVLSLQDGKTILTVGSETQTWYIVELDFNNSIMVFIGELDFAELEVSQRSYDLYDLFDLSGSSWITTGSTDLYVPRVPPRGGDYLYSDIGYPYQSIEFSDRNFFTTEFTSPSSSDDNFSNPLQIPYIFRNSNDIIENVYVEDSDQIYVVSSVSSSTDINNTEYIYDQTISYSGFFFTGSYSGSIYVDSSLSSDVYQVSQPNYNTNIVALNPISSSFGELNFVLLTDSGSTNLPTNTSSLEFHYEEFQSGSIIKSAIALRNIETNAKFYYNNSLTSQSVLQSYSGSTNIELSSIDIGDFTNTELWFLSTGSQVILDFETGNNSHFFYIDYRTNRNSEPLNADLQEITAISQIGTTDFTSLKAREIFPYSGSTSFTGSVTSTDYYTSQLPLVAGNCLYQLSDYPFVPATISDGTYITDDVDPNTDAVIPDTQFNIPYVFDTVDGKVENVLVKRLDSIYTASSTNGTSTTSFVGPVSFIPRYEKENDIIVPKTLTAFITGSYKSGSIDVPFTETLLKLTADQSYKYRKQIQHLFTMPISGSGKLGFDVRGDGWQLSKIDLKPTQDAAFSPKVFNLLDEQDRNLPTETFDYRFELYDVNNNYIPVDLKSSKTFSGGNKVSKDSVKILTFETDKSAFRFYSGSLANPPFQQIKFNFSQTQALSGSLTFESSAFDKNGNYIDPLSYSGDYPGGLTNITANNAILPIANFSGSDVNYEVSSIIYTASVQGIEEYETVIRLEDGQPIADLIINNDRNVVTFKQSSGLPNPPNQLSTIKVKRKNLASNVEVITVNSSSLQGIAPPLTLLSDNPTTGVATYFVSGSDLSLEGGVVQYEFTASDEFLVQIDNSTTITPISFLGGVVLYLSNERGVLPAYFSGVIPSSSYVYTSGSTKLYIEGEEVSYDNGGELNSYRITGVTGSGITPNEVAPTTNNYGGVPGTMLAESSSMEINVRYTDSSGEIYDFGREANFNIVREGEQGQPGLEGANGPGLVYTGPWSDSRDYQVTESDALSRADAVSVNGIYYLAITGSGPGTSVGAIEPPNEEYWEELGSGSRFVAAELAIFEESYVQNTINIGTNNSGSTSAANITLSGGTNYPYMSIGQGGETGTQGYGVGNGIFLGRDGNDGEYKFSLEKELGDHLKWDGSKLDIQGSLMVGEEGSGIYLDGENKRIFLGTGNYANADTPFYVASGSAYFSLGDKLTWDGSNLTIEGSIEFTNTPLLIEETQLSSSNAVDSASLAQQEVDQVNTDLQDVIAGTTALENGSGTTFINAGIIYSPNIGGAQGFFSNAFRVGYEGITLDGTNKKIYTGAGFHANANTPFYVDNSSNFSLGDKLTWDGTNLSIEGSITLTNNLLDGYAQSSEVSSSIQTELDGALDGYAQSSEVSSSIQNELAGALDGYVENSQTSSLITPSTFEFGPSADYQLSTPTANITGLYLGNEFLGYYNDGWKTFMGDDGTFYLGGTTGALQWDGGSNLVISGSIYAENGTFSGNLAAAGGTFSGNLEAAGGTFSGNLEAAGGTFGGTLEAGTILSNGSIEGGTIRIGSGTSVFSADTNGLYLGNETFGVSPFRVSPQGTLNATGASISGTFTAGDVNISSNQITVGNSGDILFKAFTLSGLVNIGSVESSVSSIPVYDGNGNILFTLDTGNLAINTAGYGSGISLEGNTQIDGSLSVTTSITSDGNITAFASDDRLKTRFENITEPLVKIKKISGFKYKFNDLADEVGLHYEDDLYVGVSAQEVEKVLPEVVKPAPFDTVIDGDGKVWSKSGQNYKTVQYEKIVPLLIEGIKELTDRVEKLEEENKKLKGQ